ncbi:Ankyrin-3 [Cytospora mali]|uniref:Ankyrin-3 n=1 Tax=Cytospora mali TaxID=578113 RepID=A0A194VXZ2_CYTMA|nr:Ankyrin-3 [Valsa mali]
MAQMEDLPTELITYVTDHLQQAADLAAFARTSRKLFNVVDPILYKFAKTQVSGLELWHPLRWGAENGQAGTLRKALLAGFDANLSFDYKIDKITRDMQSFQIRVEAVDGNAIWDPPEWDPSEEWRPTDHDTDHDYLGEIMSKSQRTAFDPFRGFHQDMDTDHSGLSEYALGHHHHRGVDLDPWAESGPSDEDDADDSSNDSEQDDDNTQGFRALHLAARGGHDDAVEVLLDYGADIDVCSRQLCSCESMVPRFTANLHANSIRRNAISGFSPLHLAICHFQVSTAKLLLSRGAIIRLSEPRRDNSATALHDAAATGQVGLCEYLLDHGFVSDVGCLDNSRLTPLYYAYFNGHWDTTVAFLLERGADIDYLVPYDEGHREESCESSTMLYEACHSGRYEDAIKLVHLGANVNRGSYKGVDEQLQWPIHAACRPKFDFDEPPRHPPRNLSAEADKIAHKRVELIELLLRQGADIEAKSCLQRESPLHEAVTSDNDSVVHVLLAAGADVESRDLHGRTPLMLACVSTERVHSLDLIILLLDRGSKIDATDDVGNTALHLACTTTRSADHHKKESIVRLLLERGARESTRNKLGIIPFEAAFTDSLLPICNILLRRRRTVQSLQHEDLHRMLLTIIRGQRKRLDALDLLLDLDTDRFLYTKSTYIMEMVERGHYNLARAYLERSSTPPLTPKEKITILQAAIEHSVPVLAKRMLSLKVSVNFINKNGYTPLYALISSTGEEDTGGRDGFKRVGLVKALLDAGADIHFKPQGTSIMRPLEKAIVNGEQALVDLMLQHQPLRNDSQAVLPPVAPRGVYLHAAARAIPSKRMFSALIRSGASVTELDSQGDTPLSTFLRYLIDQPAWLAHAAGAAGEVCAAIWYLWSKDVDINRKNRAGKSILSYLKALMLYNGNEPARATIASELRRCVGIVPAEGPKTTKGDKTLKFYQRIVSNPV